MEKSTPEQSIIDKNKPIIIEYINNIVIDCIGKDFIDKYLDFDNIKAQNLAYVDEIVMPIILELTPKYQQCVENNTDDREDVVLEFSDLIYESRFIKELENIPIFKDFNECPLIEQGSGDLQLELYFDLSEMHSTIVELLFKVMDVEMYPVKET